MRSSQQEETFTTPVEHMRSEKNHSDTFEHEKTITRLETECSKWIKKTVYMIDSFADLNSVLSALKTPAELGFFRNLNHQDSTIYDNIDTNNKAFQQLQERFIDKKVMIDETKMLRKDFCQKTKLFKTKYL